MLRSLINGAIRSRTGTRGTTGGLGAGTTGLGGLSGGTTGGTTGGGVRGQALGAVASRLLRRR